jgi:hypothetical protein
MVRNGPIEFAGPCIDRAGRYTADINFKGAGE